MSIVDCYSKAKKLHLLQPRQKVRNPEDDKRRKELGLRYTPILDTHRVQTVVRKIMKHEYHPDIKKRARSMIESFSKSDPGCLSMTNGLGDTALHLACKGNSIFMIKILVELGADPKAPHKVTGLFPITYLAHENIEAFEYLLPLSTTLDANVQSPSRFSPLHVYCNDDKLIKQVQKMIELEVPLNMQDANGHTPLHRAVLARAPLIVRELLLQPQCDLSVNDKKGKYARDFANESGNPDIISMFKCVTLYRMMTRYGHLPDKAEIESVGSQWIHFSPK